MEYIYAAMLLHKAGQKIDEANVKKVLEAAHVKPDEARVKALVAALDGVNIDEAIKKAAQHRMSGRRWNFSVSKPSLRVKNNFSY